MRDGLQKATLVGQGPRPKTVKLAGAVVEVVNSALRTVPSRN